MDTFNYSKFDEYDRETAIIQITMDSLHGCYISGCTSIYYVDAYDGSEKDEVYEYRYHFDSEELRALIKHLKSDFSSYYLDKTEAVRSLSHIVSMIIKKEFDFSSRMPGTLHEYAYFY